MSNPVIEDLPNLLEKSGLISYLLYLDYAIVYIDLLHVRYISFYSVCCLGHQSFRARRCGYESSYSGWVSFLAPTLHFHLGLGIPNYTVGLPCNKAEFGLERED